MFAVTPLDVAVIAGTLSSDPVATELPSGSTLVRYEVSVPGAGRTETVPVCWFDPRRPPKVRAGSDVVVLGRVRRRFFTAGGSTRSSTEVVADVVLGGRDEARVRRALSEVICRLDAAVPAVASSRA